jgi:hypothetical protein
MNIKTTGSKKKLLLPFIGILVVSGLALLAMHHYQFGLFQPKTTANDQKIDLQKPTEDQVTAGTSAKEEFSSRSTEASQERQAANGSGSTATNQDNTVQTIISSSNVNGNTLSVRSIIQTIDGSGTCNLVFSKSGSQSINNTAGTQTMGSYTTCKGFDIDITGFTKGDWEIKLTYKGSNNQSGYASKMVTLQ